jgi:hypothetical protein
MIDAYLADMPNPQSSKTDFPSFDTSFPPPWWTAWVEGRPCSASVCHGRMTLLSKSGYLLTSITTKFPKQLVRSSFIQQTEELLKWLHLHQIRFLPVGTSLDREGSYRSLAFILVPSKAHQVDESSNDSPDKRSTLLSLVVSEQAPTQGATPNAAESALRVLAATLLKQVPGITRVYLQPPYNTKQAPYSYLLQQPAVMSRTLMTTSGYEWVPTACAAYPHFLMNGTPVYPRFSHAPIQETFPDLYFSRSLSSYPDGVKRLNHGELVVGPHGGLVGLPRHT